MWKLEDWIGREWHLSFIAWIEYAAVFPFSPSRPTLFQIFDTLPFSSSQPVFQTPWRNTLRLVMLVHAFITLLLPPYGIVSRTWWRREARKVRSSRTSKMPRLESRLSWRDGTSLAMSDFFYKLCDRAWFVIENNVECNSEIDSFLDTLLFQESCSRKCFELLWNSDSKRDNKKEGEKRIEDRKLVYFRSDE